MIVKENFRKYNIIIGSFFRLIIFKYSSTVQQKSFPITLLCLLYFGLVVILPNNFSLYAQNSPSSPQVNQINATYDGKNIKEIIVEGNTEITSEQIIGFFGITSDTPLDFGQLRRNFKIIYQAGFLKDIKIDIVEETDGLIITFIVEENLKISEIFFAGNEVFSDLQLLDEMKTLQYSYFDSALANDGRYAIIRKYLEKGYLDVQVDYQVVSSPVAEEQVDVNFLIKEGPRYLVKEINFIGNTNVEADTFRDFMNLKIDTFLTSGFFDPLKVEIDKQRIEYQMRDNGYYKGVVNNIDIFYEWKPNSDKKDKYVIINIDVTEGEKHYFGKVSLKGNTLFSEEEIFYDFQRKPGEVFRQSIHDQDIQSIYQKYQPNGYIFVRITPIETINEDYTIDYVLDIYEGDKAHIEKIFIEGLTKTKPRVVLRELEIEEGEIFDTDKVRASLLNISRLDFFANLRPDYRTGTTEGLMNLYFLMNEKNTGIISGGFSYSFSTGFALNASVKERNFLGLGHEFGLTANVGLSVKNISVDYSEPWLLDLPISLGGSLLFSKRYLNDFTDNTGRKNPAGKTEVTSPDGGDRGFVNNGNNYIQYTEDRIEASISSGQRFLRGFQVNESLSFIWLREYLQRFKVWPENYNQFDMYEYNKNLFSSAPPDISIFTIKFGLGISFDNRDSILNPSSGIYSALRADLYFLGYSMIIWSFDTGLYQSVAWRLDAFPQLLWKLTFAYKFKFKTLGKSIIGDYKSSKSLNFSIERTDVRGWEYSHIYNYRTQIGGSANLLDNKAYGQSIFIQNFEIMQNFGFDLLQLVYFFDMGNLSTSKISFIDSESWNFLFNWNEFLFSTGFGIKLNLAQLPIRLYFAWRFVYDNRIKQLVGYENPKYSPDGSTYKPTIVFDVQGFF